MKTGVVTSVYNESLRLKEWISFHKSIGFDHIIVIDDNSTDDTKDIINLLDVHQILGAEFGTYPVSNDPDSFGMTCGNDIDRRLHFNYTKGLRYASSIGCDWVAFIDPDEFIVPKSFNNIHDSISHALKNNPITQRLHIPSFDFEGPFDLNKPILTQSFNRWSEQERNSYGFRRRCKSIVNVEAFYVSGVLCAHNVQDTIAVQTYGSIKADFTILDNEENLLMIHHYRNPSLASHGFSDFDDSILKFV